MLKWEVQPLFLLVFQPQNLESLNISFFLSRIKFEKTRLVPLFKKNLIISCRNRGEIKGTRKFWPVCHCPLHNHVKNRSQPPKINMAEIWNFIITSNMLNHCLPSRELINVDLPFLYKINSECEFQVHGWIRYNKLFIGLRGKDNITL